MSGVAIGTTAILLIVLSTLFVLVAGLDAAVNAVESRVNVIAYIDDGSSSEAITALDRELQANPSVTAITYVGKAEAMAKLQAQFAGHPELLGAITDNPLPASLGVTLKDPTQATVIEGILRGNAIVSDVELNEDTVDRLIAAARFVRWCGIGVVIGLGIAVIFVMINVARVAIYARRQEIEVMRLVGASDWFVRWPFVLEGMLCGLLAALIAVGLVGAGYHTLLAGFRGSFTFLPVRVDPYLLPKLLVMAGAIGIGVGGSGSLIAVHRFWER